MPSARARGDSVEPESIGAAQRPYRSARQRNATADIFHFVGAGYEEAEPGSIEADLEFLARAAAKIDRIRNDIGSAGPVIADQVEEAMLGGRSAFDEQRVDETVAARAKLTQKERNLRDKIAELASAATESRDELGLHLSGYSAR